MVARAAPATSAAVAVAVAVARAAPAIVIMVKMVVPLLMLPPLTTIQSQHPVKASSQVAPT